MNGSTVRRLWLPLRNIERQLRPLAVVLGGVSPQSLKDLCAVRIRTVKGRDKRIIVIVNNGRLLVGMRPQQDMGAGSAYILEPPTNTLFRPRRPLGNQSPEMSHSPCRFF